MKRLTGLLAAAATLAVSGSAQADVHEYYKCKLADGHTMAELMAVSSEWRDLSDAAGYEDYLAEILVPQFSEDLSPGTFYWEGTAPSLERLGAAIDWYNTSDDTAEVRTRFNELAPCESSSVYHILPIE